MTKLKESEDLRKKIDDGLDLAFKKLLEAKKQKNSMLVISHEGKIIHVKPEWFDDKIK